MRHDERYQYNVGNEIMRPPSSAFVMQNRNLHCAAHTKTVSTKVYIRWGGSIYLLSLSLSLRYSGRLRKLRYNKLIVRLLALHTYID